MEDESLRKVGTLFGEALERPPEERTAFLDEACNDDPGLRREVEELLSLHDQATQYFDELSGDIVEKATLEVESSARPRLQIGPYRALEAIGRGGMGVVYRAERVDGAFDQTVALKLLHRDMETPELKARFLAEYHEKFGSPYAAAASGHVDDVILPRETRARLVAALGFLGDKQVASLPKKHGSIPL